MGEAINLVEKFKVEKVIFNCGEFNDLEQELSEKEYNELTEDEKRFYQRDLTRKGIYSLNIAARNAGVRNFDKFHNRGYKDYIMMKQRMILQKERNLDIEKIY